ncbi:MAG: glycosyltransferase family 39 protein [candidate division Zixibacteria bacterium]|nr:glycosyltransferase family 39 protein [candidate division Zixibacteria bacterium]
MQSRTFRRTIYLILILSVVLRVGFLASGDVLPVMWDARRYAAAALGLISLIDQPAVETVADEREDRYRFKHYYDKYIQGEKIEWLSYSPHTLTQAREELFISGPLYPSLLASIFVMTPSADFTFVRILGILFDLAANLLLIMVGVRLVGRLPALLAGIGYAIYFPFVLSSSMILLDTSTNFWILLALYLLLRAFESNSRACLFWAGAVTGLLILNKPTAMLLAGPLLAGMYFYVRPTWPTVVILKRILWYAAPLGAIAAIWVSIASVHYGQLAVRDPGYAAANLRQSSSIEFEGYDLDKVGDDFWSRSVTEGMIADPMGLAGLVVKKFDRLWRRPYNDFRRTLVVPYQVGEIMHLAIVVLGLAGLLLLLRLEFRLAAWLLFIIGYYTLIHVVFHSNSRYNLNAMPMVLLAAGHFVALLGASWRTNPVSSSWRLVGVAVLLLATWQFGPGWINTLFGSSVSRELVIGCLILKALLLASGFWIIGRLLIYDGHPRGTLLMTVGTVVIISVTGWTMTLDRDRWSEFECRLTDPHMVAGTRIYISHPPELGEGDMLSVVVDINTDSDPETELAITLGDWTQQLSWKDNRLRSLFYPKPTYRYYSELLPLGAEAFRQYLFIHSLPLSVLDRKGFIDIQVSAVQNEDKACISLWGNFQHSDDKHYIPAVRFTKSSFTSIERFVHEDDPRIQVPVKYLSDSAVSYYIPHDEMNLAGGSDLSPEPGIQSGRYNIFLLCIRADSSFEVY